MNKNEIMQYAIYVLWGLLILVLTLIINRKVKQRAAAKKALLNPMVNLYPFELTYATGAINFFFDADDAMEYKFFVTNFATKETEILAEGKCRKGGQKIPFNTSSVSNGTYFFGIETEFQRVEKRIVIRN